MKAYVRLREGGWQAAYESVQGGKDIAVFERAYSLDDPMNWIGALKWNFNVITRCPKIRGAWVLVI